LKKLELQPKAEKFISELREPNLSCVVAGIAGILQEPPKGDIKKLRGNLKDFRLRVGKYRVMFTIEGDIVSVYEIDLRDKVYKKR
jgi:mRNA interferase RelE/StbE